MIVMALIYIAGILSGILLVAIGLAGWVRNAGKKLGGDTNQTPHRIAGVNGTTYPVATSVARDGAHSSSGTGRHFARAA